MTTIEYWTCSVTQHLDVQLARNSEFLAGCHISYLYAGNAECNSSIVDLVVAEVLEQRVADLSETQSLLAVDYQTHY